MKSIEVGALAELKLQMSEAIKVKAVVDG